MKDKKRFNVRGIPAELIHRFKVQCALECVTMGQGLIQAMAAWVEASRKKRGQG